MILNLTTDLISEIDRSLAGEKTIPNSGIGEAAEAAVEAVEPAASDEADREQEAKYLNNVGRAVFNTLTGSQGVEQMTDPNLIREFLTSPVFKQGSPYTQYDNLTQKDLLIDYLVDNRIPIDGRKNPWKTINNNIDAHFIDKVRRRQGLAVAEVKFCLVLTLSVFASMSSLSQTAILALSTELGSGLILSVNLSVNLSGKSTKC
jgi:hypothetical protein